MRDWLCVLCAVTEYLSPGNLRTTDLPLTHLEAANPRLGDPAPGAFELGPPRCRAEASVHTRGCDLKPFPWTFVMHGISAACFLEDTQTLSRDSPFGATVAILLQLRGACGSQSTPVKRVLGIELRNSGPQTSQPPPLAVKPPCLPCLACMKLQLGILQAGPGLVCLAFPACSLFGPSDVSR